MKSRSSTFFGFFFSFVLCFLVAGIGAGVTAPAIPAWYAFLHQPSWNPPKWVFGPVWTLLYAMMATAAGLVWSHRALSQVRMPLGVFLLQLALNLALTLVFFGAHQLGGASVEIILLDLAIAATLVSFSRVHPFAAWLLVPYLAWTLFASMLCLEIWRLNS